MKKLNNKGITLVELIIAIGIFACVMVIIMNMMVVSSRSYSNNNDEVNAQNEAQSLMNQVDNILTDASEITQSGTAYIIKRGTTGNNYFVLNYSGNNVYYYKQSEAPESMTMDYLLAEDITRFTIDFSNLETYSYVVVDLTVKKNSKSFTATKNVFLRNVKVVRDQGLSGEGGGGGSVLPGLGDDEVNGDADNSDPINPPVGGDTPVTPGGDTPNPDTPAGDTPVTPTKTVTGIRLNPSTVTINAGESLGGSNVNVLYVYSDGSTAACNDWSLSDANPTSSGTVTVTDRVNSFTADLSVTVNAKTITGIEVSYTGGTKKKGDNIASSDVTVKYVYSDNSTETITDWEFRDNNATNLDQSKDIWVKDSTGKYQASFHVDVVGVSSLLATNNNTYYAGEEFQKSDFTVTVNYSDNTVAVLPPNLWGVRSNGVWEGKIHFEVRSDSLNVACNVDCPYIEASSFSATLSSDIKVGDTITKDSFDVKVKYQDGSSKSTSDFEISGLESNGTIVEEGKEYVFKISVGGKTANIFYAPEMEDAKEYELKDYTPIFDGLDVSGYSKIKFEFTNNVSGIQLDMAPWWIGFGANVDSYELDIKDFDTFKLKEDAADQYSKIILVKADEEDDDK